MPVNDWLSRRQLYTPQRIGVVDEAHNRRYSYTELDARATQLAIALQASFQLQAGDRVACLSNNRIEYIDLYFACGKIGAVLVPLNHRLPATAIIELLEDCQASVLVYESVFAAIAEAVRQIDAGPQLWPIEGVEESNTQPSLVRVMKSVGQNRKRLGL